MLNVVLQDNLKAYLAKHHYDNISLRLVNRVYASDNIKTVNPRIRFKPPHDIENYDRYDVDGVHVYVEKNVTAYDDTIEFVDETVLGIHRFHVQGIKTDATMM